MSTLPKLEDWTPTRDSLHTVAQVIGTVQKGFLPPMPNALHLALHVTADGLRTHPLPEGYDIEVDFSELCLKTRLLGEDEVTISDRALQTLLYNMQLLTEKPEAEHALAIEPDKYTLQIDIGHAAQYAEALHRMYTALARFRARLGGTMTPLVLWPHHFDLSFVYFLGEGSDEHKDPHINFGFAPFSDDIDRPYFYTYLWPLPDDLDTSALPAPATWHDTGWQGARIDYDTLVDVDAPEALVEATLQAIHAHFAQSADGA